MPEARDLYEVLGCDRGASPAELKKAYYRLAKQYHPDHNPNDKVAEEKFKEASNAYQVLSDTEQRARYDSFGPSGPGGAPGQGDGFSNVEDIFSAFGDLFGDFFAERSRARQQARGADLRLDLALTFHEAVWGATKDVRVTRTAACTSCGATGVARGGKAEVCRHCQGKGQVNHAQGFFMVQTACSQCLGTGRLVKDPCGECRGRGARSETSTLALSVPQGVEDGATLRVAGKGDHAAGGAAGDLYVVLRVGSDPRFVRAGFDVASEVTISFAQAALGGEIEIATLDNKGDGTAILELSPGTQPGDKIVRRGQGIPHLNGRGRGDHHVEFKVEVPRRLTSMQERLLREFAASLDEGSKRSKRRA